MKRYDLDPISKKIEVKITDWPGNCYAISSLCLKKGIVPKQSKLCYGHWFGPVSSRSMFSKTKTAIGFVPHGWIELPDKRIFDPTRYVFESVAPYIYEGPNDFYDMGGNMIRKENRTPCPVYDPADKPVVLIGNETVLRFIRGLLLDTRNSDTFSITQIYWLANLSPDELVPYVKEVYSVLKASNMTAFIPLDNWRYHME